MRYQVATSEAAPQLDKPHSAADLPLVLGGHSFISQLGSDPPASEQVQCAIVEACLDCGIRWVDTTYQPERIALGNLLQRLGRREEAVILAWSFFQDFTATEPVGEPECYRPEHIDVILEQLRTDYVDTLIVIPVKDRDRDQSQIELATHWQNQGYVRSLGLWTEDLVDIDDYKMNRRFRFAIRPFNITTPTASSAFATFKATGLETLATSPFFRGWELDRMVAEGCARGYGNREVVSQRLADLMLRFSLFHPNVDRVIVGMRKVAWIGRNVESVSRGPLTLKELRWLQRLHSHVEKRHWWRRLRRLF